MIKPIKQDKRRQRKQPIKVGKAPESVANSYTIAMRKLIKPLETDLKRLKSEGVDGVDAVRAKWNAPDFLYKAEQLATNFVDVTIDEIDKDTVGLDVLANNKAVSDLVDVAAQDNFRLIKSLPNDVIDKAEAALLSAARKGIKSSVVEKDILEMIKPDQPAELVKPEGMSDAEFAEIKKGIDDLFAEDMRKARIRAKLIARDQAAKIQGQVSRARQQGAGFKYFRWSTSKDIVVRHRHKEIAEDDVGFGEGIYSWDDLPLSDSKERIYPGSDYQCRCTAIPVFEDEITK